MVRIRARAYRLTRIVRYLTISGLADAQSPVSYHFSMILMTFYMKSDGIDPMIAASRIQMITTGVIFGK